MLEYRCWTRKLREPTFQSPTPSSSSGRSSASTDDSPSTCPRARDVVVDLAVDDARRRVVKQPFGQFALAAPRGAGRVEIRESRCMTTTFWTPSRRESLKEACSHSPTPGIASARQASSKTLMTFAGGLAGALRDGVKVRDHRALPR